MFGVFLFVVFVAVVCLLRQESARQQKPWWVKINTEMPQCTYFFGPFDNVTEAQSTQGGYIEDLKQEGAEGIHIDIARYQPELLTIYEE